VNVFGQFCRHLLDIANGNEPPPFSFPQFFSLYRFALKAFDPEVHDLFSIELRNNV
jgi:hypothetical protein